MSVKVLTLVTINEEQPRALASYLNVTGPLLEAVVHVQRFSVSEAIVGDRPAQYLGNATIHFELVGMA